MSLRPDVSAVFPPAEPFITKDLWVFIISSMIFVGLCFGIPIGYFLAFLETINGR